MITPSRITALVLLLSVLAGCASSPTVAQAPASTSTAAAGPRTETPPAAADRQIADPSRSGPKKRVAVIRFENVGRFAQRYGDWDVGGGLAAQLTTALIESGKFIVVERTAIGDVLREQEMGLEKVVSKETAAKAGQVLGAQLLVKGAVTEFEQDAEGGGLKLGVNVAPGVTLGGGGTAVNAQVGLDLRLIDTATGQVVRSVKSEGKATKRGIAASIDVRQVSLGGDAFNSTPLGQATRQAIERAVAAIYTHMERLPWTARVMEVVDGAVYINAGQEAALRTGDRFDVTSVVRELTDPDTGQIRAVIENKVGQFQIEKVEDKYSVGRMVTGEAPKRGDVVKYMK
jgi:curli biogenesis system outer membrane secretion channel CsgG